MGLEIQNVGDSRKSKLNDTSDLFKFFAMVRNLILWMDDLMRQMKTSEKPRDVSGVELLMNNQQEHLLSKDETPQNLEQAESLIKKHEALLTTMEANDDKVNGVLSFAERLVCEQHFASEKIAKKAEDIQ